MAAALLALRARAAAGRRAFAARGSHATSAGALSDGERLASELAAVRDRAAQAAGLPRLPKAAVRGRTTVENVVLRCRQRPARQSGRPRRGLAQAAAARGCRRRAGRRSRSSISRG